MNIVKYLISIIYINKYTPEIDILIYIHIKNKYHFYK